MAKNSIGSIVSASMPGWELIKDGASRFRDDPDRPVAQADQVGEDLDALRRKYLKANKSLDAGDADDAQPGGGARTTRLARVRNTSVALDSPIGAKTVLVDETRGKIIGKQG